MVNHIRTKFSSHRHCGSRDKMVSACHVILQEHMTKGLGNIMDRGS